MDAMPSKSMAQALDTEGQSCCLGFRFNFPIISIVHRIRLTSQPQGIVPFASCFGRPWVCTGSPFFATCFLRFPTNRCLSGDKDRQTEFDARGGVSRSH